MARVDKLTSRLGIDLENDVCRLFVVTKTTPARVPEVHGVRPFVETNLADK